jgi:peptidylprolyl isomerase
MKSARTPALALTVLALLAAFPVGAEEAASPAPSEIVAAAPRSDWSAIAPADLLVMDLAPDPRGRARRVVIQLMPPPFSQGWIGNIRALAAARWWDGLSVNRVQDNYVAQWGDADGDDPAKAKALPAGLAVMPESEYVTSFDGVFDKSPDDLAEYSQARWHLGDSYSREVGFSETGWPFATAGDYRPAERRRNGSIRKEGDYTISQHFFPSTATAWSA